MRAPSILCVTMFIIAHSSGRSVDQDIQVEATKLDLVKVKNNQGQIVSVIEAHVEEGYQVIKPTSNDQHTCLIASLEEKKDTPECYDREPIALLEDEEEQNRLKKECLDREAFLLRPRTCEYINEKSYEIGREKRNIDLPPAPPGCVNVPAYKVECQLYEDGVCMRVRVKKVWTMKCV